jgi:hypothetical protein
MKVLRGGGGLEVLLYCSLIGVRKVAKLRPFTSSCPSARLLVCMEQLGSTGWIFIKFDI